VSPSQSPGQSSTPPPARPLVSVGQVPCTLPRLRCAILRTLAPVNPGQTPCRAHSLTLATRTRQTRCQSAAHGLWQALASRPLCRHGGMQQPPPAAPQCPAVASFAPGRMKAPDPADCGQDGLAIFVLSFCASFHKSEQGQGKAKSNGKPHPGIWILAL
jgi:hypothetical protein